MGTEATPLAEEPTTPRPGIRPAKVAGWALLCAIALAPVVARSGYLSSMGCQIATSAIIVVGLGLLMGYAGQISLGHAAFYAIGAYSSAILTTKAGVHPLLALCAGAAASAAQRPRRGRSTSTVRCTVTTSPTSRSSACRTLSLSGTT